MKNSKSILVILVTSACLFSGVLYTSCKKKTYTSPDKCSNVVCKNGGICIGGKCSCPNGYEDADCGTASISRYLGTWTMRDSVIGSNHPSIIDSASVYSISITAVQGKPAEFNLSGITGNAGFINLPCKMEDTLTRIFDPLQFRCTDRYGYATPTHLTIVYCIGILNFGGYYIHGRYVREYPLPDSTLQTDTLSYYALKQ